MKSEVREMPRVASPTLALPIQQEEELEALPIQQEEEELQRQRKKVLGRGAADIVSPGREPLSMGRVRKIRR